LTRLGQSGGSGRSSQIGDPARQQLTIHVYWHSGEFPDFAFAVHGDEALNAFHHPDWFSARELAA